MENVIETCPVSGLPSAVVTMPEKLTSLGTVLDGVAVCAKSLRMAHKSSVVSRVVLFMVGNYHFIF